MTYTNLTADNSNIILNVSSDNETDYDGDEMFEYVRYGPTICETPPCVSCKTNMQHIAKRSELTRCYRQLDGEPLGAQFSQVTVAWILQS